MPSYFLYVFEIKLLFIYLNYSRDNYFNDNGLFFTNLFFQIYSSVEEFILHTRFTFCYRACFWKNSSIALLVPLYMFRSDDSTVSLGEKISRKKWWFEYELIIPEVLLKSYEVLFFNDYFHQEAEAYYLRAQFLSSS